MPIDTTLRLLFIHVPKTAGYSVQTALGMRPWDTLWDPDRLSGFTPEGINAAHLTFTEACIRSHLSHECYSTAVVRNPFTRCMSLWAWCQQEKKTALDFNDFVMTLPYGTSDACLLRFFLPQWEYVRAGSEVGVSLLGRFEDLKGWWAQLVEDLHATLPALPRHNATQRIATRDAYTPDAEAHVRNVYAADFEMFDYPRSIPWN